MTEQTPAVPDQRQPNLSPEPGLDLPNDHSNATGPEKSQFDFRQQSTPAAAAPVVEVASIDPDELAPGDSLTIQLRAQGSGEIVRFEYRVNGGQWIPAPGGHVRLSQLKSSDLQLDFRALDNLGTPSEVVTRTWRLRAAESTGTGIDPSSLIGRSADILMVSGDLLRNVRLVAIKRGEGGAIRTISFESSSKVMKKKRTITCGFDRIKEFRVNGVTLVYDLVSKKLRPPAPMILVLEE